MQIRKLIAFVAVATLAACGSSDPAATTVSFSVKDAPVDSAEAVVITFTGVQLLGDDDSVAQTFILDEPQTVDLLSLQGTQNELLIDGVVIEPGVYRGVRFQADFPNANCNGAPSDPVSFVQVEGQKHPLILPSGELKVQENLTIAQGTQAAYTVDFDLRRGVTQRGATGCFNLRPVLRITDDAEVGTIQGTVDGGLVEGCSNVDEDTGEGAAVYVYSGDGVIPDDVDGDAGDPVTSAMLTAVADASGSATGDFSYEVGFLLAGSYTLAFTCDATDDDPDTDNANGDPENDTVLFESPASVILEVDGIETVNFPTP